tara:strand:- start:8201 stop:8992 length:792 start_codon:yes stop_codon:yes gene_type:complete
MKDEYIKDEEMSEEDINFIANWTEQVGLLQAGWPAKNDPKWELKATIFDNQIMDAIYFAFDRLIVMKRKTEKLPDIVSRIFFNYIEEGGIKNFDLAECLGGKNNPYDARYIRKIKSGKECFSADRIYSYIISLSINGHLKPMDSAMLTYICLVYSSAVVVVIKYLNENSIYTKTARKKIEINDITRFALLNTVRKEFMRQWIGRVKKSNSRINDSKESICMSFLNYSAFVIWIEYDVHRNPLVSNICVKSYRDGFNSYDYDSL